MTIYIIVKYVKVIDNIQGIDNWMVESVWETKELANAAVAYYARQANIDAKHYIVCERELNVVVKR